jgi:sigma-E factor negative regulatory protein RseC
MLEEVGIVVEVRGGYAWVETERRGGCGGCESGAGCGTGVVSGLFGRRPVRLRSRNGVGAVPGDRVVIAVDPAVVTRAAIAVYAIPLAGLLAGSALGQFLTDRFAAPYGDVGALVLGVVGFSAALLAARRTGRQLASERGLEPVVVRRVAGVEIGDLHPR